MEDIHGQKKSLRSSLRRLSSEFLSDGEAALSESAQVWGRLETMSEFAHAHTVLVYMSIPGEVITDEFLARWRGRKRLVLPRVEGERLELLEYNPDRLVCGYKGIMEPSEDSVRVPLDEIDLAVIPGVAFTRDGRRLGHGGGFYDRLLSSLDCPLIGVCYSFRLLDDLPCEEHDRPVDLVISG